MVGEGVSYVDFFVYEVLDQLRTFDSKCLDEFPNLQVLNVFLDRDVYKQIICFIYRTFSKYFVYLLQAYTTKIENIPQIQKYIGSSAFLKGPLYSKTAIIKI